MIAGPNGSGKSTLFDSLAAKSLNLGHVLNPDQLEREIADSRRFNFAHHNIETDDRTLRSFFLSHNLGNRLPDPNTFGIRDNTLELYDEIRGGYFVAVLADFLRRQWLATGQTFTFESVMSSQDKVDLLAQALSLGYRTYVYYVCTDSPIINRERVANRVIQGGHPVPPEKIDARYQRSLSLLPAAVRNSSRAYLFDNSGTGHRLIAEFEGGTLVAASRELPGWFVNTGLFPHDL